MNLISFSAFEEISCTLDTFDQIMISNFDSMFKIQQTKFSVDFLYHVFS